MIPNYRKLLAGISLATAIVSPQLAWADPVKIIFDTDYSTDCDDPGALAVLHALADNGEAEILATGASTSLTKAPGAIDVVNTYYGRPNIPIGVTKVGPTHASAFAAHLFDNFPHNTPLSPSVQDVVKTYRQVLAAQPNNSVVLVTVGYLTNVSELLKSPPDQYSSLNGHDLVALKVKEWACMGGNFFSGETNNVNFTRDPASAYYAIQNFPKKLTFMPREVASVPSPLRAGQQLMGTPTSNPVRIAYQRYFDGSTLIDRHCADLATVLYAVRGIHDYWDIETDGSMNIQAGGGFTWNYAGTKDHNFLVMKGGYNVYSNAQYVEDVLRALVAQPPGQGNPPPPPPPPPGGNLPSPWAGNDIGSVGVAGSATHNNGTFTVKGSGIDIHGTADSFQFAHQLVSGDCDIRARVTSQSNTDPWAKAGVMIRETLQAGSRRAFMAVTPSNGFRYQPRTATNGNTPGSTSGGALNSAPNNWVRLVRAGNVVTAYKSSNGTSWTQVATTTITMNASVYVGLAVCSHNNSALSTAVFDNVSVTGGGGGGSGGLPSPWTTGDIGSVGVTGEATHASGVYTVKGSGVDIYGTADSFRFAHQPASGDCDIRIRVSAQTNTNAWAKAGVMIRESLQPNSRFTLMAITPSNGFRFQTRTTTGGGSTSTVVGGSLNAAPNNWVRLTRSGNTFTGYKSVDGVTWTQVASTTVSMGSNAFIGLAVCSHNNSVLSTATIDNVTVTP